MRVAAVIQARLGSTRLPGKVLRGICSEPMIAHVVRRVRRLERIDWVGVAIPDTAGDDPLAEHLATLEGVAVTRGPEDDVLARYVAAAEVARADAVVRITADCPLLCPSVSQRVVDAFIERTGECDYASNTLDRTFPRGLDTEVVSVAVLRTAHREASETADREHVTRFIWSRPERFRLHSVTDIRDRSHLRWTVDTKEDLALVSRIYEALRAHQPNFDYPEILDCIAAHPEWLELNRHVPQKPAR
jgi:spore coat polysaccharide biosynthesis protein SpsF